MSVTKPIYMTPKHTWYLKEKISSCKLSSNFHIYRDEKKYNKNLTENLSKRHQDPGRVYKETIQSNMSSTQSAHKSINIKLT